MKILIVSYSPLSLSSNGGKHMISLLKSFSSDQLIQFYVTPTLPDCNWCKSYYRQTDLQLIKQLIGEKNRHIVYPCTDFGDENTSQRVKVNSSNYRHFKLLVRDFLWGISGWYNKELKDWISRERPDCIFADTGDSCFLYNVTIRLSKEFNLPVICSFGDDYYSIHSNWLNPVKKIQTYLLKKKIKEFVEFCNQVITINDMFSNYYQEEFGEKNKNKVKSVFMGNTIMFSDRPINKIVYKDAIVFSYIGNQSLGRWENLVDIGLVLDEYNEKYGTKHVLMVYGSIEKKFRDISKGIKSIVLHGFIPGKEVIYAMENSDVLIHTESFKADYICKTKYSLSTKIADSLASGKLLLAYGPAEVASMDHLIRNNCAYIIDDKKEIYLKIKQLLDNIDSVDYIKKSEIEVAHKFHDSYKNSLYVRNLINKMILKEK